MQAGGKGGARVKGPSGGLASVNGEANTLQGPNHSIQGTLPNSGGHNHNDIIKVGEHAAGRGESDQAALDVLEGGGETDSKQGRRQRATLVNAPRGMNRRSRAPLPPVKVGGALAQPSHDRRHQTRGPLLDRIQDELAGHSVEGVAAVELQHHILRRSAGKRRDGLVNQLTTSMPAHSELVLAAGLPDVLLVVHA